MIPFYTRKKDTLCGALIDIGSGSIAASIVLSRHSKELPEILYTHRELMVIAGTTTPAHRVRSMQNALFLVMRELEQKGIPLLHTHTPDLRIQKILVSCAAPWSHTITQIIHVEKDAPFTVTPHLIDEMIEHAYEKEQEAHAHTHEKVLKDVGQQIVEKSIIDVTLNGYSVQNPYNKKASEITIAHLRGLVADSILVALERVKKHIPSAIDIHIHTSALILYCVFRDLYPKTKNALIIDISGETTEVSLMQNSILYESITIAYGTHSLVRTIARSSKTIPEEARAYLRSYKQKVLSEFQEKVLVRVQKHYTQSLMTALTELTTRYVLPQTVFLILDQNMEHFFTDTIENAMRGQTKKNIVLLSPQNIGNLAVRQDDVSVDPHLSLIARFFHKLHACGEIREEEWEASLR